jgi:hypothetical protein
MASTQTLIVILSTKHGRPDRTWSRFSASTRYPDDPDRAKLEARVAFEAEQAYTYGREYELYGA